MRFDVAFISFPILLDRNKKLRYGEIFINGLTFKIDSHNTGFQFDQFPVCCSSEEMGTAYGQVK